MLVFFYLLYKITSMASEKRGKLNKLLRNWPSGMIGTIPWFEGHGIYQQLLHDYKKNGWIEQLGSGAYRKAGDRVNWANGLNALQVQLKLPIHVGGKSALELRGFEHFVTAGEGGFLYLFSDSPTKLPSWFKNGRWDRRVSFKLLRLFPTEPKIGLSSHSVTTVEISISTPERAILEVLELVPKHQSFEEARLLMEGLVGLRAKMVQSLLEQCRSVKAKRLFLYLAENCNHTWFKKLDPARIDLGRGKRVIVPGGSFDSKYQITVARTGGSQVKTTKGKVA